MDWLSAVLGQQAATPSAVGESYLTKMDQLKQQQALMEALRTRGMRGGNPDQVVGGGRTTSFGDRPGIVVPGNNGLSAISDILSTAMGQYGADRAGAEMGELAGRNDQEFRAALERGGFPQGGAGNFPKALPQQAVAQGATLGDSTQTSMPDSAFTEAPMTGAEMIDIAKMRKDGMSDADIAAAMTSAASGEAPAPASPEIAEPDVTALNASIPASGQVEPILSAREKWMIQTARDFPKSAASMNSMLQAESNIRRDMENQPLKMALAEMRINQAADLAASKAQTQRELEDIRQAQRIELERIRQGNRVDLKTTPGVKPVGTTPGVKPVGTTPAGGTAAGNGASAFNSTITMMRDMYSKLNKSKGITSTGNTPVQNVKAYAMSSAPGQILGKALGTKDQSLRNTINQSRPLLVRGIAEATGMSAKNIDSNAELKLWLDAASNPDVDIDANLRALKNIEDWVNTKRGGSAPAAPGKTVVREVTLKDGRIGVEYSDGSRGYK